MVARLHLYRLVALFILGMQETLRKGTLSGVMDTPVANIDMAGPGDGPSRVAAGNQPVPAVLGAAMLALLQVTGQLVEGMRLARVEAAAKEKAGEARATAQAASDAQYLREAEVQLGQLEQGGRAIEAACSAQQQQMARTKELFDGNLVGADQSVPEKQSWLRNALQIPGDTSKQVNVAQAKVQVTLPKLWGACDAQTRHPVRFLTKVCNFAKCAQQSAALALGDSLSDALKRPYKAVMNQVRNGSVHEVTWQKAVNAFAYVAGQVMYDPCRRCINENCEGRL